ncbi:DNA-binding LacI/PurR family transcriptional regulator [Flavobacterium sp. 28A]|uniref:substrate-binding domain-containing protein n=1 Tax=Flavobacterium sp. 28A TaxID=2735895 RepID=UPI00157102AE|nr:substrate-binding domain-containing protein [Flavobacterium sp. 28A]NRT14954.1 DNA-binding LacI/PurR family transcriptional regulator [Flavobacterium sp. 28A]
MKIVLADKTIDGLLYVEESSAMLSLDLIKKMQYKIPDEMAMICFTNGKLPQHVTPTIITIGQHGNFIGEMAIKMLVDRLESKTELEFSTKIIKTSLIQRQSTAQVQ